MDVLRNRIECCGRASAACILYNIFPIFVCVQCRHSGNFHFRRPNNSVSEFAHFPNSSVVPSIIAWLVGLKCPFHSRWQCANLIRLFYIGRHTFASLSFGFTNLYELILKCSDILWCMASSSSEPNF